MLSKPFRLLDLPYPAAQRVMDLMTPAELIMMSTAGNKLANFTQFYIREDEKNISFYISESRDMESIDFTNDPQVEIEEHCKTVTVCLTIANGTKIFWTFYAKTDRIGVGRKIFKFGALEFESEFDVDGNLKSYMSENLGSVIQFLQWLQFTLKFKINSFTNDIETHSWWTQLFNYPEILLETKNLHFEKCGGTAEYDQMILHIVKMRAEAGKTSSFSNLNVFYAPFIRATDIMFMRGHECRIGYNFLTVPEMYEIVTYFLQNRLKDCDYLVINTAHWFPVHYQELKDLLNLVPLDEDSQILYYPGHNDFRAIDEILWTSNTEKAVKLRMNSYDAGHIHIFPLFKREVEAEEGVEEDEGQNVEDEDEEHDNEE